MSNKVSQNTNFLKILNKLSDRGLAKIKLFLANIQIGFAKTSLFLEYFRIFLF